MFVCQQCSATFSEAGFCAHDGSPLESSIKDPLIGTNVGAYKIDALIGVGGMGRVYKAIHPKIGSRVAVKVLSHDCALKPDLVARFFDEARAVNVIRHESIVNILDLNTLPDKRPYIIMEFLDGKPLSSFTERRKPLPIGTILQMFEDILGALDAAHQQRIVHRDLKPDNIFISPKGRPKVLDFGIAKLASEESSMQGQTRAGSLLGTPHYMSPEQALSRPADARSDLYAIGVILYECLTGQVPFQSDNLFKLLQQHVDVAPQDPRILRPELSLGLAAIVLRALAKDPDQRWQSASELIHALQAEQHGLADTEWSPIASAGTSTMSARPSRPPSLQPTPHQRRAAISAPPPVQGPASASQRKPALVWPMVALASVAVFGIVWASQRGKSPATAEAAAESATADVAGEVAADSEVAEVAGEVVALPAAVDAGLAVAASPDAATAVAVVTAVAPVKSAADAGGPPLTKSTPVAKPTEPTDALEVDDTDAKPVATSNPEVPVRDEIKTQAPSQVDVTGYLAEAQRRAEQAFDDAVLFRIDADGVRPNGKADLTLGQSFSVTYRFMSKSRAKRPKGLTLGVEHKPTCIFYVSVGPQETSNYALAGWDCSKISPTGRPRCTSKQIWQRAIADGAPKNNAVAEIGYRKFAGAKKWYFDIKGVFSKTYNDDC